MPRKPAGAAAEVAVTEEAEATGFCSSCGAALEETSRPVFAGFDPVTGLKLPDRIVTRRKCPTGGHDRYVKTDEGWARTF